jgi:hypothetical protein
MLAGTLDIHTHIHRNLVECWGTVVFNQLKGTCLLQCACFCVVCMFTALLCALQDTVQCQDLDWDVLSPYVGYLDSYAYSESLRLRYEKCLPGNVEGAEAWNLADSIHGTRAIVFANSAPKDSLQVPEVGNTSTTARAAYLMSDGTGAPGRGWKFEAPATIVFALREQVVFLYAKVFANDECHQSEYHVFYTNSSVDSQTGQPLRSAPQFALRGLWTRAQPRLTSYFQGATEIYFEGEYMNATAIKVQVVEACENMVKDVQLIGGLIKPMRPQNSRREVRVIWPEQAATVLHGGGEIRFFIKVDVISCMDFAELHLHIDGILKLTRAVGCSHEGQVVLSAHVNTLGKHSAEVSLVESNSWEPETLARASVNFESVAFCDPQHVNVIEASAGAASSTSHSSTARMSQQEHKQTMTMVFSMASSNLVHIIYHVKAWRHFCRDTFNMTLVLNYAPSVHPNGTWDQGTWFSPTLLKEVCKELGVGLIIVPLDVGCGGHNQQLSLDWLWQNVILAR